MSLERTAPRVFFSITGAISAALMPSWVLYLRGKYGWDIRIALTPRAERFVTPEALSAISGNPCLTEAKWFSTDGSILHRDLAANSDLVVLGPATLNSLGKLAAGICDNLALVIPAFTDAPVVVVPSISFDVFERSKVQQMIRSLAVDGVHVMSPGQAVTLSDFNMSGGGTPTVVEFVEYVNQLGLLGEGFSSDLAR